MNRRNLLQILGVSGTAALAGCSGAQEFVRSGPPYFEDVQITGPDEVETCEEINLEVSVTNTGGESGEFTARMDIREGIFQTSDSIAIEDVQVTETKTANIGPYWSDRTAEIPFRLSEHAASHTVAVTTRQLQLGDAFDCGDRYRISLSSPEFTNSLTRRSGESTELVAPEQDGRIFALIELDITLGNTDNIPPYRSLSTSSGDGFTLSTRGDLSEINELDDPFSRDQLESGSESGTVVFEVETAEWDGLNDDIIKNVNPDTPPDVRWSLANVTGPSFSVDIETPDNIEIGQEGTISVVVKNTGGGVGTYRAALLKNLNGFGPQDVEVNSAEVEAGEQEQIEFGITPEGLDKPDYELVPGEIPVGYSVVPVDLDFGGKFTTYEGGTYVVDAPLNRSIYADEVSYIEFGSEQTEAAGTGETFVILDIEVDPEVDSILNTVDYSMLAGGQEIEPFSSGFGREYTSPVSGSEYPGEDDTGGLLVFRAPESVRDEGVVIQAMFYGEEGDYPVQWS